LDTFLINLDQLFLSRPSHIELTVKVVLTHVSTNRILASKIIHLQIACPYDTPYGGVVAANKATGELTALVSTFVLSHLQD
jgi:cholesterol transport system auxiliary component